MINIASNNKKILSFFKLLLENNGIRNIKIIINDIKKSPLNLTNNLFKLFTFVDESNLSQKIRVEFSE